MREDSHHAKKALVQVHRSRLSMCGDRNPAKRPETREKIRQTRLGKRHKPESIAKMSLNHADFSGDKHPMWGRHHAEETRAKMRESSPHICGRYPTQVSRTKMSKAKLGDNNPMKRPEVREKITGDKNPMKRPETAAKTGKTLAEGIVSGRIKLKGRGMGSYVFSAKMDKNIYADSTFEARAIRIFDGDPAVVSFIKNPFRIAYQFEGKDHYYIPDFEAVDAQGGRTLIEVLAKYTLADLRRQAKLEAGRKFARDSRMAFSTLTEDDLQLTDKSVTAESCRI